MGKLKLAYDSLKQGYENQCQEMETMKTKLVNANDDNVRLAKVMCSFNEGEENALNHEMKQNEENPNLKQDLKTSRNELVKTIKIRKDDSKVQSKLIAALKKELLDLEGGQEKAMDILKKLESSNETLGSVNATQELQILNTDDQVEVRDTELMDAKKRLGEQSAELEAYSNVQSKLLEEKEALKKEVKILKGTQEKFVDILKKLKATNVSLKSQNAAQESKILNFEEKVKVRETEVINLKKRLNEQTAQLESYKLANESEKLMHTEREQVLIFLSPFIFSILF